MTWYSCSQISKMKEINTKLTLRFYEPDMTEAANNVDRMDYSVNGSKRFG